MWESELVAGQGLPPVCAVTGKPASGWQVYDFILDPDDDDAAKLEGRLPVCAQVLRRRGS